MIKAFFFFLNFEFIKRILLADQINIYTTYIHIRDVDFLIHDVLVLYLISKEHVLFENMQVTSGKVADFKFDFFNYYLSFKSFLINKSYQ